LLLPSLLPSPSPSSSLLLLQSLLLLLLLLQSPLPLPFVVAVAFPQPTKNSVIPTEAPHSFIVRSAVEEPPHFAFAVAVASPSPTHQKTCVILSGGGAFAAVVEGPAVVFCFLGCRCRKRSDLF